ncbi:MAG: endonuclease domain-containing protein, partial [Actinomycetota bacterium]|nr:endonuclease domain-containing protein [Actinomycetota bacterium]
MTIPPDARRRRAGITVRRRALDPQDVTTVNGLRVTAWPRTVLDVAAVESPKRLALALDRTVTLQIFDLHAVDDLLERHPRAHGAPALQAALTQMTDEGQRTASPHEIDVHWLVLSSDLLKPLVNHRLLGYVVDLYWPAQRLIVEVDSSRWHDGPFARRHDHHRQAALEAAGHAVLRVRRSDPPAQILQRIDHALAARSVDHPAETG